jgi:hypothetical protein
MTDEIVFGSAGDLKREMDHEIVDWKNHRGSYIKIRKLNSGSYDWEIDLVDVHSDPTVASSPEAAMRWAIKHIDDHLDVDMPAQAAAIEIGRATQLAEDSFGDLAQWGWETIDEWALRTMDTLGVEYHRSKPEGEPAPFQFDLPVREYVLCTWASDDGMTGSIMLRREWDMKFTPKNGETQSELNTWWAIVNHQGLYFDSGQAIEKDNGVSLHEAVIFGMNERAPIHCRWSTAQDAIDFWINNRHLIDANIFECWRRVYGTKEEAR